MLIDIRTLTVLKGKMSRRALELVIEWAGIHRDELTTNWELCQAQRHPNRIEPL